ncbi:MAG: hypothetical protein ACPLRW_13165, partial [Moorellales bacterium]
VENGPLGERAFHGAEGVFRPGQKGVGTPGLFGTKIGPVVGVGGRGSAGRRATVVRPALPASFVPLVTTGRCCPDILFRASATQGCPGYPNFFQEPDELLEVLHLHAFPQQGAQHQGVVGNILSGTSAWCSNTPAKGETAYPVHFINEVVD